jgi:hypothetical protein
MSDERETIDLAPAVVDMPSNLPQVDRGAVMGASLLLNEVAMRQLHMLANVMAEGTSTVPKHFQGKPGDCMAVCIQAAQWNMNPYAVAQKTHIVNGSLGYEAQLVNAVIQESGLIEGRFHYEYQGAKGRVECRVAARLKGEAELTWGEWLCEADVKVKNSPLWVTNPKQQLGYLQVKNWGRAFAPGAILGVYTPDELQPAKNMGAAQVVPLDPPADLVEEAEKASKAGQAAYAQFWEAVGKENRRLLAAGHEERKRQALRADSDRTIDNGAQPEPTRATPMFSVAKVTLFLNEAQDEDELNAAADLIKHFADPTDVKALETLYDNRLKAIRKE